MEPNFFRYVWRHTRREQVNVFWLIAVSLPFYFASFEIPKRIINEAIQGRSFVDGQETAPFLGLAFTAPGWLGGTRLVLTEGFLLERVPFLFALSFTFLALVFINGGFKRAINTAKGILGERMMRRMRFDLFALLFRLRPEDVRAMKPSEISSTINNEVEPIGGFIGDAFIQPALLGTQALTALAFITLQNVWLGLVALSIVLVQAFIIPRMRKEQLRLGRQRQSESRKLAGRIGELVEITPMIRNHAAGAYSEADIGQRLGTLFTIRVKLYERKFAVKFLNNLLAQVTPFFFFAIGGYLAITGSLDIGQLVVAIAAYRDLPPPIKDLIDWDQMRSDSILKYQQIIAQFPTDAIPVQKAVSLGDVPAPDAPLAIKGLRVEDKLGNLLLEPLTLQIARPAHVALVGESGSGRDILARVLGRQISVYSGAAKIGFSSLGEMADREAAGLVSYAGPEPMLFQGSIRDNVLIALVRAEPPPIPQPAPDAEERLRRREAERSGNPVASPGPDWLDPDRIAADPASLDLQVMAALRLSGVGNDIFRLGLQGKIRADRKPETVKQLLSARQRIQEALKDNAMERLIEPFDADRYHQNSSIGENLLFGVCTGKLLQLDTLGADPYLQRILTAQKLVEPLEELGLKMAESAIEMFSGLPPGHPLFERFSFVSAEIMPDFIRILEAARAAGGLGRTAAEDRASLVALALGYIEPRYRLGLIDAELEARIIQARKNFRKTLPLNYVGEIEFYEANQFLGGAPIADNLLFGRIAFGVANADTKVNGVMIETLRGLGLESVINGIGLDSDVGPGGRMLFPAQRSAIALARALVAEQDMLVLDGALNMQSPADMRRIIADVRARFARKTLFVTLPPSGDYESFDHVLVFEGPRLVEHRGRALIDRDANAGGGSAKAS